MLAVSDAFTAANAALIEDVAVAVASAVSDAFTATNAALVEDVAVAVASAVSDAFTATNATLVKDVAVTVASAVSDAFTATNAALVKDVAVAVALTFSDAVTATAPTSRTLPQSLVKDAFTATERRLVKDAVIVTATNAALVKDVAGTAVASAVSDAFTAANATLVILLAGAVVPVGVFVVVARRGVGASFDHSTRLEFQNTSPFLGLVCIGKNLQERLTREFTFGGDLHHQDAQILVRKRSVVFVISARERHIPPTANPIIDSDVLAFKIWKSRIGSSEAANCPLGSMDPQTEPIITRPGVSSEFSEPMVTQLS